MTLATIKPSALTQEARAVLEQAPAAWAKLPKKPKALAAIVAELELFGLVQTQVNFVWSKTNSGAGRHVTEWRKTPEVR